MKSLLGLFCVLLSGCFAYIPVDTRDHERILWRATYDAARAEASHSGKPIVVVMGAGERDGLLCLGAHMLRTAALADARVIDRLNRDFVPVWINVRTTPIPAFPFRERILVTGKVDQDGRVTDTFSRNYFVRSVVVSPDGERLLSRGESTVAATAKKMILEGDMGYEAIEAGDYLTMLKRATSGI